MTETDKRFFIQLPQTPASLPMDLTLTDALTCHHLRTVIRAKIGDSITIVDDSRETAYEAVIRDIARSSVFLTILQINAAPAFSAPSIILAATLIKEQRWDWLLQKATELGVRTIQPLITERTVIRLSEKDFARKQERWQLIARAAAEQSEGLFIPQVLAPQELDAFFAQPEKQTEPPLKILMQERGHERLSLKTALSQRQGNPPVMLVIGPEGGWTDAEIDAFQQAGFTGASLGNRILRSETAAISAIASVIYEMQG